MTEDVIKALDLVDKDPHHKALRDAAWANGRRDMTETKNPLADDIATLLSAARSRAASFERLAEIEAAHKRVEAEIARLNGVADNLVIAAEVLEEKLARLCEQIAAIKKAAIEHGVNDEVAAEIAHADLVVRTTLREKGTS